MASPGESYFGPASYAVTVEELPFVSNTAELTFWDIQRKRLLKFAETYLNGSPEPVIELVSAGTTTITPAVKSTRTAFQDFVKMQVMTQWWKVSGDVAYLNAVKTMILAWANKSYLPATPIPSGRGHPINQTHFRGLHWTLRSIAPGGTRGQFTTAEYAVVTSWLQRIKAATLGWGFPSETGGGTLTGGNHYTHHYAQYSMLLESLGDWTALASLWSVVDAHALLNFPYGTGESIDYRRRQALHYQSYDIQPWLDIAMTEMLRTKTLTGTYGNRYLSLVQTAMDWMWTKGMDNNDSHTEFQGSTDEFDAARWAGSHSEYLQPDSLWTPDESARTWMEYYNLQGTRNPSYVMAHGPMAVLARGDRISSCWPYWFRFVLGV